MLTHQSTGGERMTTKANYLSNDSKQNDLPHIFFIFCKVNVYYKGERYKSIF